MKDKINIGFIGAGNLGRHAILGLIDSYEINVSDPMQNQEILSLGITYISIEELCKNSDVIFLTIKPNISEEILSKVSDYIDDKLIISFIAGMSLKKLEKLLLFQCGGRRHRGTAHRRSGKKKSEPPGRFFAFFERSEKKNLNVCSLQALKFSE